MPLDTKNGGRSEGRESAAVWVLPAALRQLAECGDTELVEELMEIFRTDTASRLHALQLRLDAGDFAAVRVEAHTIKGSALQLGANRLAAFCQQLEAAARNGEVTEMNQLLEMIHECFGESCAAIASRKESTGNPLPW